MSLRILHAHIFPPKPQEPSHGANEALTDSVKAACGESTEVDLERWCPVDYVTGDCADPPVRSENACYSRGTIQRLMTDRRNPGYNRDPLTRRWYSDEERALLGLGPHVPLTEEEELAQQGYLEEEEPEEEYAETLFHAMKDLNEEALRISFMEDPETPEKASDEDMLELVQAHFAEHHADDSKPRAGDEWAEEDGYETSGGIQMNDDGFIIQQWVATALELALELGNIETASFLVEHGAVITKESIIVAWLLYRYNSFTGQTYRALFVRMLQMCPPDTAHAAFCYACGSGPVELVRAFLDSGKITDVNKEVGSTPLLELLKLTNRDAWIMDGFPTPRTRVWFYTPSTPAERTALIHAYVLEVTRLLVALGASPTRGVLGFWLSPGESTERIVTPMDIVATSSIRAYPGFLQALGVRASATRSGRAYGGSSAASS